MRFRYKIILNEGERQDVMESVYLESGMSDYEIFCVPALPWPRSRLAV